MKAKKISLISLIIVFLVNITVYASNPFNKQNVYNTINELSSPQYRGRLAGDSGNELAENYVADYFKNIGLKPGGDEGTYFQAFDILAPSFDVECYIKAFDEKLKPVREFKYGFEFVEPLNKVSSQGTIRGKVKFNLKDEGNILCVGQADIIAANYSDEYLKANGVEALLYEGPFNSQYRASFGYKSDSSNGVIRFQINQSMYYYLKNLTEKNTTLEIKSSLKINKTSVNNVIGILEGKDKTLPPIILSCHLDHVGYNAEGKFWPGAFDNASGTAFIMEYARVLKDLGIPNRTIIFAAFNAEEYGLLGSKYFVENPPLDIKNAECINFDMVGTNSNLPLSIMYASQRGNFAGEILDIAGSQSVKANLVESGGASSDHAYFDYYGINAVTLIQYDLTKIHTFNDDIKNVNVENIDPVLKTLNAYMLSRNAAKIPKEWVSPSSKKENPSNSFTENVHNIIAELTSDKYKGRVPGNPGSDMAAQYIADYFKGLGLKPAGEEGTYFQKFDVYVPKFSGESYFRVFDDKGNLVKDYKYGTDYIENTVGSPTPGTFRGKLTVYNGEEGAFKSNILLYQSWPSRETIESYNADSELKSKGADVIITAAAPMTNFQRFGHAKLQMEAPKGPLKIKIADGLSNELTGFANKNYTFEIKSTFEVVKASASNVLAYIEGKDKSLPPVILSGHYDHAGFDSSGIIHPGAYDNASGVSTMMGFAKVLKNSPKPERSIIFIAFSGEEEGLVGSNAFAVRPIVGSQFFMSHSDMDISKAIAFNFDMVGTPHNLPLTVDYSGASGGFAAEIIKIAKSLSIDASSEMSNGSDHDSLSRRGIKAVSFFYDDRTNYHLPSDKIDYVKTENLKDIYMILDTYLHTFGIDMDSPYDGLNKSIFIYTGGTVIFVTGLLYAYTALRKYKFSKNSEIIQ